MSKPQNNSKHNSDKITQALTLKIYFEKYLHTQKFSSVEDYIECFYSVRGKHVKFNISDNGVLSRTERMEMRFVQQITRTANFYLIPVLATTSLLSHILHT